MTNPIGKEARGEVCRSRLGVSEGAVVRARAPGGEIAGEGQLPADRDGLARLVLEMGDEVKVKHAKLPRVATAC